MRRSDCCKCCDVPKTHCRKSGLVCRGCGRQKSTCWNLPCLELEQALESGERAVNLWLLGTGMRVSRRAS